MAFAQKNWSGIFRLLLLPSIVILHTLLIFLRGYFLSIEFTLYPFLRSQGFLPYKDIIDQHFPALMFGPFSLPSLLTSNPWPLLAVFLVVLCLTDIILYSTLIKHKVKLPLVWVILYVLSSVYFSGNVLWLETFVNLFLVLCLRLSFSDRPIYKFIVGLLLSQIILMRPTILPAIILIFYSLSLPAGPYLIGGLFVGFLIPGIYLYRFGLLDSFYRLAIVFNGTIYPQSARLLPAKRQVLMLVLWFAPSLYLYFKNKKYLVILSLFSLLVLIVPRFGFEHLQPLFLCGIVYWAIVSVKPSRFVYLFIFVLFVLNIISAIRHPYGNYFLTPQVQKVSEFVKALPGNTVYLLGASDLIYPLSGKYPPNITYVPSLPWYLAQQAYIDAITNSLKGGYTPILVDHFATVDGKNVVEASGPIIEYIKMNYTQGENLENYVIYYPNP